VGTGQFIKGGCKTREVKPSLLKGVAGRPGDLSVLIKANSPGRCTISAD